MGLLASTESKSQDFYVCHYQVKTGKGEKVEPLILYHSEQVLARPVSLTRWSQPEQFRALLRMEENPEGKTTRH